MEAAIISKATQAIETFLNRRNYTILSTDWAHGNDRIDFITEDEDGDIAFVTTNITENTGDGFPEEHLDRDSLERVAIAWLAVNLDLTDRAVRFDYLNMLVIGESRAMIRHHIGCMSCDLV